MKTLFVAAAIIVLAGCGVESLSTAVTAASIKAKEIEEAKKAQERAQQKIDQATQLMQQRAQQPGNDATR